MDTGRLGWAKATRSQMVLVKNADSQAYPRPILSLDVGPRGLVKVGWPRLQA